MIDRRALPGVGAGVAGFLAAIAGMAEDQAWLVVVAGVCALLAGLYALVLADRLRRSTVTHEGLAEQAAKATAESDEMAARAARFETEALRTRAQLAETIRHEGALGTSGAQPASSNTSSLREEPTPDPVIDPISGLFNGRFFMATLEKRVSAARRGLRPLGLVLLEVVTEVASGQPPPADPKIVAEALLDTLREADTVARLDDGRFAVLLEDTPENGAIWTIERVRRRLAESHPGHTVWAGLSCYPAHAFEQEQLIDQARNALTTAKEWRQDRIEVAVTPED